MTCSGIYRTKLAANWRLCGRYMRARAVAIFVSVQSRTIIQFAHRTQTSVDSSVGPFVCLVLAFMCIDMIFWYCCSRATAWWLRKINLKSRVFFLSYLSKVLQLSSSSIWCRKRLCRLPWLVLRILFPSIVKLNHLSIMVKQTSPPLSLNVVSNGPTWSEKGPLRVHVKMNIFLSASGFTALTSWSEFFFRIFPFGPREIIAPAAWSVFRWMRIRIKDFSFSRKQVNAFP